MANRHTETKAFWLSQPPSPAREMYLAWIENAERDQRGEDSIKAVPTVVPFPRKKEAASLPHTDPQLHRQNVLRTWHTRPDLFPEAFDVHWKRGDFDALHAMIDDEETE